MSKYPKRRPLYGAYAFAKERYALLGVDTDEALERLATVALPIRRHA